VRSLPLLLLAFGVVACDRGPSVSVGASLGGAATNARVLEDVESPARGGDGLRNGHGAGRGRGRHNGDCPVLVDGELRAVLRYHELPPSAPTLLHPLDDGRRVERFALGPYLAALGVDLARLKAVHLQGGDGRVSVLEGAELRRVGERLHIHFTAETAGRPTFKYPGVALATNTTIDGIHALAVYVDAEPPTYRHGLLRLGGVVVDGGVGEAKLAARGTRVYRDGKLLRTFRRRDVVGDGRSLAEALTSVNVSLEGISRVELVGAGETLRAHEPAALPRVAVSSPRGTHGRLAVDEAEGGELDAILLYADAKPSLRHAKVSQTSSTEASAATPRFARLEPTEVP
jgi:hypothetical protein